MDLHYLQHDSPLDLELKRLDKAIEEQTGIKMEETNKMEQTIQTNQENMTDWLNKEAKEVEANRFDGEILPSLVLEEGKVTDIEVDFSSPFQTWTSPDGVIKKIIPVIHAGERKTFWLNVKNPLYHGIIVGGSNGQTKFKVMRTGQKQNTRYTLVKD